MDEGRKHWLRVATLSILGIAGVLSALPLIPQLLQITGQEVPIPMAVLYAISTVQSSAMVIAMVFLGVWVSPKVKLGTPLIDAYLNKALGNFSYKHHLYPALLGGLAGGVLIIACYKLFLPYLPGAFVESSKTFSLPIYTKLLYGGITEEILIRFGLMSFLTWGIYRITQKADSEVGTHNYVLAIVLSSVMFGLGHLPTASLLSPVVTSTLVTYIVLANSIFGLIAGFLYWKRGLEAAIVAHMVAHIVMIVGEKLI